jgi:DNA-binding response OmpR family regulator
MSTTRRSVVLLVQRSRDDGLDMYAAFLRYHGLALIAVSNARDALLLAPRADIIVTGIILDDPMDGLELVSRLRHDAGTRHTPVVVLTACTWATDREHAEYAGCDVFLPKPCLPGDLLREVRRLLRASRARHGGFSDASMPRTQMTQARRASVRCRATTKRTASPPAGRRPRSAKPSKTSATPSRRNRLDRDVRGHTAEHVVALL